MFNCKPLEEIIVIHVNIDVNISAVYAISRMKGFHLIVKVINSLVAAELGFEQHGKLPNINFCLFALSKVTRGAEWLQTATFGPPHFFSNSTHFHIEESVVLYFYLVNFQIYHF